MHKYGGTSSTFVFRLNLMYQCIKHDTDNMSTATLGDKTNISRRCWIFNVICRGSFCMFNDLREACLLILLILVELLTLLFTLFCIIQVLLCQRHNIQQQCNDIQIMTCLRHNMTTTM